MSDLVTTVVGPSNWPAMRDLFEPRGLAEDCWCTYFRMTSKEYSSCGAAARRDVLQGLVVAGQQVGVLGSVDDVPVGWIGVGPHSGFSRLHRSRVAKLLEDDDLGRIWSIVCVYLASDHRHRGLVEVLVDRATEWARDEQAELIEAYPVDDRVPGAGFDPSDFHGRVSTFEACGFTVVEPRSQRRALVRKTLQ